jgi:guanylate kinase
MEKGLLIVVSGPSGVGKGTVREQLFNTPNHNLHYSISMTTRLPREGEIDGIDYFFVTKDEFLERVKNDDMLEWAEFVGNYYGTPLEYVEKSRLQGKDVVLEIEVQGAMQVKNKVNDGLFVFLAPPSIEELENRLLTRGTEELDVIKKRIDKARNELPLADSYDYVVVNDDVHRAAKEILDIIDREKEMD